MLNDTLANALNVIKNAENVGKKTCTILPTSKIIEQVLAILNEVGYVGVFEKEEAVGGTKISLNLLAKVNDCSAIKPRTAIKFTEIEKFEKRFLPASNIGILIVSTSQGIMTNQEARKRKIGGALLAYCY